METNWAAEHLQTIRTLMERSALYRRALAPISTFVGCVGIVAAIAGWGLKIESDWAFTIFWLTTGLAAVVGALVLVRRQALRHGEIFWSPPTRRVAQAMMPALLIGLVIGLLAVVTLWKTSDTGAWFPLIIIWTGLYGLALNAAGFFMPRGIRLFGWGFIVASLLLLLMSAIPSAEDSLKSAPAAAHWLMCLLFGASHLAYGIYLYFTERKNEA